MEGAPNEPFFELLHPRSAASPPSHAPIPPPPPPLPLDQNSSLEPIPPSYDFRLTHFSKSPENSNRTEDPLHLLKGTSPAPPNNVHHHHQGPLNNEKPRGPDPVRYKEDKDASDRAIINTIEATMKTHTEKLLYSLEGVSARLAHLENTVQGLEHSLQRLKLAEDENQNESNHKLMKLENLLGEVHARLQIVQDKQQVLEQTKSQLQPQHIHDKMTSGAAQVPDTWQQNKEEVHSHITSSEPPQHMYPPQLPTQYQHQAPPPPPPQQQQQQSFPPQNVPPQQPPQQQSFVPQNAPPPPVNEPKSSVQQPYPTSSQPPQQPYQQQAPPPSMPPFHYQQAPPPPQASYNPSGEAPAYGHMQQQPHPVPPSPAVGAGNYIPELPQYPPGAYQPSQQQHVPNVSQPVYDGRVGPPPSVNMSPPYGQVPPQQAPPLQAVSSMYETSSGGYGAPPYRAAQPVPSAPTGGYPRLPTAQPVAHSTLPAVPISSSSNRSPVDEIIEKVVSMGFSRDQARGVVRHLTENGQSVELNVVLDKLMNGRDSVQPQRGWFGRG